jgi:hypothetical protein
VAAATAAFMLLFYTSITPPLRLIYTWPAAVAAATAACSFVTEESVRAFISHDLHLIYT